MAAQTKRSKVAQQTEIHTMQCVVQQKHAARLWPQQLKVHLNARLQAIGQAARC
jgi:hypothetical protein